MSKKEPMSPPVDPNLMRDVTPQKEDTVIFFLDEKHIMKKIVVQSVNEHFFVISQLLHRPFNDAVTYLCLNRSEVASRIEQTRVTGYDQFELNDKQFRYEYSLAIACYSNQYTVILKVIDRKNDTLKSYINTIINTLPGAVYWKDREGHYLGCNKSVAHMAGFEKPEQLLGKTDFDLCWKEFAPQWREFDLAVMHNNKTYKREESAKLADGRVITEITIKSPLYNEKNEIVGIIGTSMDITEQKLLEQDLTAAKKKAEEANQAKTEFLENMRHDIRTPLTGIVGFADILKAESTTPEIKEYAENLVASSHALLDLLEEVLEAIRVSSGEIPIMTKKFNIKDTLIHLIELNRAKAAQKRLKLSLHFDEHIPELLIGDKVRIHRVILELIANAMNFTDQGYIKVSVVLAKHEGRDLVLKFIVEDSGIGIPKDKQQEIYLQFKRLTPSYQGIYKGAGLGLSVVKQFVDELEGEIYVESNEPKGSRFTCIIPLREPLINDDLGVEQEMDSYIDKRYKTYDQEVKPIIAGKEKSSQHVLIVEDNKIAQIIASSILSTLDCTSDIAESGKEAVELWRTRHYDIILMDIGLPDIDGYEITHRIRVEELAKKTHIPIIALTAHVGDENKKRCIEAGMNAVLSKPLTAKACMDVVDAFIPGRASAEDKLQPHLQDFSGHNHKLFNLTEFPLLDATEGIKTTGSEQVLRDMLQFLIKESLPQDLISMKASHEVSDWEKTQQFAHKIKGGAVYVGTVRMEYACQYLERYWKSGQRELMELLYQQAVNTIEETLIYIKTWLNG